MKRIIAIVLFVSIMMALCACSSQNTVKYSDAEKTAMKYYENIKKSVDADKDGKYTDVGKTGTEAHTAVVQIEKLYKTNKNNNIIKQIYYFTEAVSGIAASYSLEKKYYDIGLIYARQIDQSYDGPYSEEIIAFARKLVGEISTPPKSALTLSSSEKAEVKKYIEGRYDYYDKKEGKYVGDKYSTVIWEEAANKYGISTADIDLIWYDAYNE